MKALNRIVALFLLTGANNPAYIVNAFMSPIAFTSSPSRGLQHTATTTTMFSQKPAIMEDISKVVMSTATVWATTASTAVAAGPDWGIFEGKTLSRKCHDIHIGVHFIDTVHPTGSVMHEYNNANMDIDCQTFYVLIYNSLFIHLFTHSCFTQI